MRSNYKKWIESVRVTDVSRKFSETVGLLGVSPGFIDAIEKPLKNPIYYDTELTKQSYDGL